MNKHQKKERKEREGGREERLDKNNPWSEIHQKPLDPSQRSIRSPLHMSEEQLQTDEVSNVSLST